MAKLFFTFAVLCVFGAVMAEGFNDRALGIGLFHLETCKGELQADEGHVDELKNNAANVSMKAKCLLGCVMKKTGLMDDNGKFMADTLVKYVQTLTGIDGLKLIIAKEMIDICANMKVDSDPCEAAFQYSKCFEKTNWRP